MEIEWNEIRTRTIMDRWDFSWDLNPGPPQKIDGGDKSSWQPEDSATERGKAVKLAKGGAFQLQTSIISALSQHPCVYRPAVTLLFRSKPLSFPKKMHRHENCNQFPFFSQQRSMVLLDGNYNLGWHKCSHYDCLNGVSSSSTHLKLWYCRISSTTV